MSKLVKSENDQLDIDEELINEVSNADEFKDKDLTAEDVVEALQAIDALADAVLEKADAEQKELNADQLLDEVRDMIDTTHEEESEELSAEEELPEELTNAAVRVMVSDEGDIQVEKVPDEIYDDEIDGLDCTVYDTCDMPALEIEDTADEFGDDLLVIGNSKSKSFRKGYMKLASSVSKKAWSAAYKKVRKMVKSGKLTAAHWAIVSAVANKIEERNKFMKKLECALVKKIRSSADYKKRLLKSDMQEAVDDAGVDKKKVEPEEVAGKDNPGYEQENMNKSPEIVDSQSGNPTVDPEKQNEREGDIPVLDDEMITLDVPLANSRRKIALKKVIANHRKGFSAYRVLGANDTIKSALDGKVVKSGKGAFIFKDTANGLLACAAKFNDTGKGKYDTVIVNGKVVISATGEVSKVFNSVERFMNMKAIQSSRKSSIISRKSINSSSRDNWSYLTERIEDNRGKVNDETLDNLQGLVYRYYNDGDKYDDTYAWSYSKALRKEFPEFDEIMNEPGRYEKKLIKLVETITSSRRAIKSSSVPSEIYYLVVNGSKQYYRNEDDARKMADDLRNDGGRIGGPYVEDDPEEIEEVIDAGLLSSSRRAVRSSRLRIEASKKSADMKKKVISARREAALAKIEAKREVRKAQMLASRNEARLMEMHDAEERQRLFQSSQSAINEEKIAIKQGMSRNSSTLDKLYGNMF